MAQLYTIHTQLRLFDKCSAIKNWLSAIIGMLVPLIIKGVALRCYQPSSRGTHQCLIQDLVSIRVPPMPEQDGEMTVLGHITNRLIVSPNWDSLLQESGFDQDLA